MHDPRAALTLGGLHLSPLHPAAVPKSLSRPVLSRSCTGHRSRPSSADHSQPQYLVGRLFLLHPQQEASKTQSLSDDAGGAVVQIQLLQPDRRLRNRAGTGPQVIRGPKVLRRSAWKSGKRPLHFSSRCLALLRCSTVGFPARSRAHPQATRRRGEFAASGHSLRVSH
jgi:hypothetical protein